MDGDRSKLRLPAEKSSFARRVKYIQKFCFNIQNFCLYKQKFCLFIQKFCFYFTRRDNQLYAWPKASLCLSSSALSPKKKGAPCGAPSLFVRPVPCTVRCAAWAGRHLLVKSMVTDTSPSTILAGMVRRPSSVTSMTSTLHCWLPLVCCGPVRLCPCLTSSPVRR